MSQQPRVLIAEDDARLAQMLKDLLVGEGYEVTVAHDGQRALHEGLTSEFDVLLLDRGLPVIEGLDVLAKLRGQRGGDPGADLCRHWATRPTGWRAWTGAPRTTCRSRSTSTSCWPGCGFCGAGSPRRCRC